MADQELREAIAAAYDVEPEHHANVQATLTMWQRASTDDIEGTMLACGAEVRPKMKVPEEAMWRQGVYVMPLMVTAAPTIDLLAAIRDVARSG